MNTISGLFLLVLVSLCLRADSTDPQHQALSALKAAKLKADKVKGDIPPLLTKATDPKTVQAVKDCLENYASASQKIQDTIKEVSAKNYFNANTWVTAAMSDAGSCQEGLGTSALAADNQEFTKLCSTALAAINKASLVTN